MPRYEVQITETIRSITLPAPPDEPAPVFRDVVWTGEAVDDDAATDAAYDAWDQKYGVGKRPVAAVVKITPLAE